MNKLKPVAQEIIDIKKELLNKNHSNVIKKSLEIAVDRMLVEGYIDLDIQLYLKDDNCSLKEFRNIIESNSKYIKSKEELMSEYEDITKKIDVLLKNKGLDNYYINVNLKSEKINVCKVLTLDEEYLKSYFYIQDNSEEHFESLMEKKGFMHQFAALRLPRVLSNFINSNPSGTGYKIGKSHSYFKADVKRYAIDLVFSINVKTVEIINEDSEILSEIYNKSIDIERYFEEKMSI